MTTTVLLIYPASFSLDVMISKPMLCIRGRMLNAIFVLFISPGDKGRQAWAADGRKASRSGDIRVVGQITREKFTSREGSI
jgi:hypothetical protein